MALPPTSHKPTADEVVAHFAEGARAGLPIIDFRAVVPTVRGRAWLTGIGHYLLDPDDPFLAGFLSGRCP